MDKIQSAMIQSINCTVFGQPLDPGCFADFSCQDFDRLYRLSAIQDLAHLVGYALEHHHLLPDDCPAAPRFRRKYIMSLYRYEHIRNDLEQIRRVFTENRIPFLPLKGSVLRDLYPQPWMRTSCDIDVLVHEEDLERACAVLKSSLHYTSDDRRHYHDVELHSENGILLELHFHIMEVSDKKDQLLAKVWSYASPTADGSLEYELTPAYFLYYHLAHMSYHFLTGGCGVRSVMDYQICRERMEWDENQLAALCRTGQLEKFRRAVEQAAAGWFENAPTDDFVKQVQSYILENDLYGSPEREAQISALQMGSERKYTLRMIFKPYIIMKQEYPILVKHKWLTPYYEVVRWCRLLFKTKNGLRQFTCRYKAMTDLPLEERDRLMSMMERLEL